MLAGGGSRRFGRDKAREVVRGRPLILHAAELVREVTGSVTVVAAADGAYADLTLPTIGDDAPGRGPLAGLARALRHAREERRPPPEWVLVVPCDWLGARARWLSALLDARRPGDRAAAFRGEHWEPLPGLYHAALEDAARAALETDDRSLRTLLERHAARPVPLPPGWSAALRIDRPGDLP